MVEKPKLSSRMTRLALWFGTIWPSRYRRQLVLRQYGSLSELELVLADIAMRGNVWRTTHDFKDSHASAFNEGRRALALEILELANMEPDKLQALVEGALLTQDRTGQ